MLSRTKDLTKGEYKRSIIVFALPIFLSQLFQQLYNTADSLIVGNFISKSALAAVSSSGNLIFLLISFFTGLSMGAGVVISRYYGEKNYDNVSKAIHTKILICLISGAVLSVFGALLTPYILMAMRTDPNVLPESILYFRWYFIGALSMVMYNCFTGIMNALGDSMRPLFYLIFSSVLNVLLDLLFVGVLDGDVGSAAIATVISQAASALLCLIHLCKKGNIYTVSFRKLRIDGKMLKEIIKFGLPTGLQNCVIALANVLVQSNINTFGDDAMAACGTYSKIEGFVFIPVTSFSLALSTFISQNLGAGEKDRARSGARFGILTGVAISEFIGIILFIFAPVFVSAFNKDPEVIRIATDQSHIESLFFCFLAFSHCVAGICRGAGKAFVPMIIMLSIWCVLRIIYITVAMAILHDIRLLFMAYPITWIISSVIYMIYYKKSRWIDGFESKKKA